MAEQVTIARPYAEAVFRLASQGNALNEWSGMLSFMAAVAVDDQMRVLIGNPNVPAGELERLFLAVSEKALNEQGRNLVKILIENGRLDLLPFIRDLYEGLKAEHEGELEANIVSAFPLSDTQVAELKAKLEARFKRKVKAVASQDATLVGGARITIGDVVIDGSVASQLQKMANALKS